VLGMAPQWALGLGAAVAARSRRTTHTRRDRLNQHTSPAGPSGVGITSSTRLVMCDTLLVQPNVRQQTAARPSLPGSLTQSPSPDHLPNAGQLTGRRTLRVYTQIDLAARRDLRATRECST
jgi:hypothetical protein